MLNESDNDIDPMWRENPVLIYRFMEQRSDYEELCTEVVYILVKRLKKYHLEYSVVSGRAKTLSSFLGKIRRKTYNEPFRDIKDFAGIRVVCLYKRDVLTIGNVIHEEFDVLETVDKLEEKGVDRFGYVAVHYIAKLKPETSGARYEDLKHLVFEIQVRTVLQDAWAIIDHQLSYKHESEVPLLWQRKLNGVAYLIEKADDEFNDISQNISDIGQFLNNPLDLDYFLKYLSWKFKDVPAQADPDEVETVYKSIDKTKYKTLLQLDKAVQLRDRDNAEIARLLKKDGREWQNTGAFRTYLALAISDEDFRNQFTFLGVWLKFINERISKSS